ncbi:macro domain-containing protein [uncultured Fibrobacter sp.]|uniref:macro domain-containing protein n=1 Tax=uncultured Fibrobacter sp. TaxID=261512 RepID=UPI0026023F6E|nr:macro domain-containing protein [uncultured Fibrobacter sp.]
MPLKIVRDDISKVKADIIVNSANPLPICGGGAEYHIFQAADYDELLKAREQVGKICVSGIAVTPAFALKAKYIIHTVGPKWNGGNSGEALSLENCYLGALSKARELGATSIAFPLISSGVYRFPFLKMLPSNRKTGSVPLKNPVVAFLRGFLARNILTKAKASRIFLQGRAKPSVTSSSASFTKRIRTTWKSTNAQISTASIFPRYAAM